MRRTNERSNGGRNGRVRRTEKMKEKGKKERIPARTK